MLRYAAFACVALNAAPALANDSIAGVGAGGLILGRTDAIAMESEDLYISMEEVSVDYVFRNTSDKDVETIVAFPMPDIAANPYTMPMLPYDTHDNFLGFEVSVDGDTVEPKLEQRAFAVGVEITDKLKANGIPIYPFTDATISALEKLPQKVADDWVDRGIVFVDSYDDGSGWKNILTPLWSLKSTYWWRTKFPKGETVEVSHKYLPSVGASVGLSFWYDNDLQAPWTEYKQRYCLDDSIEKAVRKAAKDNPEGYPSLSENRLQYVLTTGGNWALGNIGKFHLTVDKGDAKNLVSFCGTGVKKTGPTTFELTAEQFYPEKDLDILILVPNEQARDAEPAKPQVTRRGPIPGTKG